MNKEGLESMVGALSSSLFPAKFTIYFLNSGKRQFEETGKACAERFKKHLQKQEYLFNLISKTTEHREDNDVYIYVFWGGSVYAHIILFSRETAQNFANAITEFSEQEGRLETKGRVIKVFMN